MKYLHNYQKDNNYRILITQLACCESPISLAN